MTIENQIGRKGQKIDKTLRLGLNCKNRQKQAKATRSNQKQSETIRNSFYHLIKVVSQCVPFNKSCFL